MTFRTILIADSNSALVLVAGMGVIQEVQCDWVKFWAWYKRSHSLASPSFTEEVILEVDLVIRTKVPYRLIEPLRAMRTWET